MSGYELHDFAPMDQLERFLISFKPGEEILSADMLDDSSSPELSHPFAEELGNSSTSQPPLGYTLIDLSSPTSSCQAPGTSSSTDINPVEVLHPSPSEVRHDWMAEVASMLPHDILRRAPRKRGEGKYACSGTKYKPCTQEEFIAKVDEKIRSGKYKAKRPRRQQRVVEVDELTMDQVVVALQAQAELYGNHFNGAVNYFDWE